SFAGSYFVDQVGRELRTTSDLSAYRVGSYTIRATIDRDLQRATDLALQEGLAHYESANGRTEFRGPELNLSDAIARLERDTGEGSGGGTADTAAWQRALASAHLPTDFQWPAAVVLDRATADRRGEGTLRVGLADGRILPLQGNGAILRKLKTNDVVLVHLSEGRRPRAELRVRPTVQGAAVVLENRTGRILAMSGGASYALSQP